MKTLGTQFQFIRTKTLVLFATLLMAFAAQAQFVYSFNTSSPNSCDGYAYLDSTLVDINAQITWAQTGQVVASGVWYLSNLCPGDYVVVFFDQQGNSITATFTIGSGTPNPCSGFYVELSGTDPSPNECDGAIEVSITGGTAPYTISWSNNNMGSPITDLCAGYYSCNVVDANGCNAFNSITLNGDNLDSDTIIIIVNNTFPNGSITDTLPTTIVLDCDLDFDAVYAASITNVSYDPAGLLVTWTLYNADADVLATYDLYYYNLPNTNGVYEATLIIYCDGRSMVDWIVQITDQLEYFGASAGLVSDDLFNVSVVNPMNDALEIAFSENIEGTIQLVDMHGRVVMQTNIDGQYMNLNTSALGTGLYALQISSNKGTQVLKVLK
jgi:hypothetical protein